MPIHLTQRTNIAGTIIYMKPCTGTTILNQLAWVACAPIDLLAHFAEQLRADSFQKLFAAVAAQGLPLVLSYPSEGLLSRTETSIAEIGSNYML